MGDQHKTHIERLQVELERSKQSHQRELDAREQELEELRISQSRRQKQSEQQLEDLESERQRSDKERREMEQKLRVIEEEIQQKKFSEADKKLKRDLKRYRALLEDAHIQLENYKNDSNRVNQVKLLKQEIEDLQLDLQAAIRSKKQMETEFEDLQNQHTEQFSAKTVLEEQLST